MFLPTGHQFILQLMSGEIIEGLITDDDGAYNTFHIKIGRASRQLYYWDVDYGYPLKENT